MQNYFDGMFSPLVYPLAFGVLLVASYIDIKTREVPDLLSYGLLFAGLGIRLIYSVAEQTWLYFFEGVFGAVALFIFAYLLYYFGQWGGGDCKLLMGLGALFGLSWKTPLQFTVYFVLLFFAAGAVYGLCWSVYLSLKNRRRFALYFSHAHKKGVGGRNIVFGCVTVLLFFAMLMVTTPYAFFFFLLGATFFLLYYLWLFLHVLEKACLHRIVLPQELTEGDWVVYDVFVDGKRICGPGDLGIEKHQIEQLKKYYHEKKVGKILIKEGIPFVPSFLFAYCILLFF